MEKKILLELLRLDIKLRLNKWLVEIKTKSITSCNKHGVFGLKYNLLI